MIYMICRVWKTVAKWGTQIQLWNRINTRELAVPSNAIRYMVNSNFSITSKYKSIVYSTDEVRNVVAFLYFASNRYRYLGLLPTLRFKTAVPRISRALSSLYLSIYTSICCALHSWILTDSYSMLTESSYLYLRGTSSSAPRLLVVVINQGLYQGLREDIFTISFQYTHIQLLLEGGQNVFACARFLLELYFSYSHPDQ